MTVTRAARKLAKGVFAAADLVLPSLRGPRVVIYHQVGDFAGREMEVSPAAFQRQLDWMQQRGEIVDLDTALSRWREPGAERLFVLTFDDGYRDLYTTAFPLLRTRQLPFLLYLTTRPVETGEPLRPGTEPLRWDDIREMLDSGLMTLGAHTHTHPDLRSIDAPHLQQEIEASHELIEARMSVSPQHFAYPWGYWSQTADPLLRACYRTAALGAPQGEIRFDGHLLHRFPTQRSDGVYFFRRRMLGGLRAEEIVRRRLRGYHGP